LRDHLASTRENSSDPKGPLCRAWSTMNAAKDTGRNTRDAGDGYDWTRPVECATCNKRHRQPALAALSLPAARFHDLRYGSAVNLLSADPLYSVGTHHSDE